MNTKVPSGLDPKTLALAEALKQEMTINKKGVVTVKGPISKSFLADRRKLLRALQDMQPK